MSRRRGEFEHRTSIFEGAFRAWSHLGGLEPIDLETKPATELDPLLHPIPNDPRIAIQKEKERRKSNKFQENDDNDSDSRPQSSNGREYPYEPLPRSGLVHPFVQAILSPWLGPDADQDAIQLGLTTLRTWWQHRRKGESGSAIVALGTEKMQGVVEGYTRHFFNLAHCLVVNDREQPPRTLQAKMRELEKVKSKNKKRGRDNDDSGDAFENDQVKMAAMAFSFNQNVNNNAPVNHPGGNMMSDMNLMGNNNSINNGNSGGAAGLLDRLQASQRRLLAAEGGVSTGLMSNSGILGANTAAPMMTQSKNTHPNNLEIRGRCIPGKVDLPGLVQKVNSAATQLARRGGLINNNATHIPSPPVDPSKYGDPNITPLILISSSGDIQFLMTVDGITCAHCVKIIETVLKGCSGRPSSGSPISGLLDASADRELNAILIKISNISEARRIAYESARNLSMVGYTAVARSVNINIMGSDGDHNMTLMKMGKVFEVVPTVNTDLGNVLDWSARCQCPDNNVLRDNCPRHEQMSKLIFESFDRAEQLVSELIAGCGAKYGMPCTAGNHCFCKSGNTSSDNTAPEPQVAQLNDAIHSNLNGAEESQPIRDGTGRNRMSMRMSLGGLLGRHSLTSHTTFGRAMSGLSALSIDWENMDDFDINVDHSEGINNDIVNKQKMQSQQKKEDDDDDLGGVSSTKSSDDGELQQEQEDTYGPIQRVGPRTARRSSLRNPTMNNNAVNANMSVSFDM